MFSSYHDLLVTFFSLGETLRTDYLHQGHINPTDQHLELKSTISTSRPGALSGDDAPGRLYEIVVWGKSGHMSIVRLTERRGVISCTSGFVSE